MNFKTLIAAVALAAIPAFAGASTVHTVVGPGPIVEGGLENGDVAAATLTIGDTVNVNLVASELHDSISILGFNLNPVPVNAMVSLSFDALSIDEFGPTVASLSFNSDGSAPVFTGPVDTNPFTFMIEADASPLFVVFDWDNDTNSAASYSLRVSAVPLPAGLLLLGTALGGMAVARRRKKVA
ncbi:hypothetical protein Dshi_1205 [Dinoroseobacter shibae DFL 12 = DSM 16493]|jgi:hypothetical protein|uniref:PEP-CTERM protein-sorting domain-containing protein n=1 Tax=Dinoroseobacter shibae (strain DSM 16493 / NCIMB 14021 / DFL 12) TaxID=398580 RepID=A8LI93_DINSH|nr:MULTISPECIES: VPLPA-CTERM sorting domain-containing protein [Dinoroseobacter]ABV92947.1 hypothetical protein Dshi_1205 [Dinoroseobacter shibae DFL 12 = DSM 16493]MDD9716047.1 VPLPA-CTERM sorting domain-containing protein [Dinoroseobacter sp. PD6]URF47881.1 VPLPA-CTERM sorting domain-containing protein [Dinoroseobacter shibae]URF52190.1 VPLPA-CTERM sorting domain-containing protein [Dinoroseobacter shibae]